MLPFSEVLFVTFPSKYVSICTKNILTIHLSLKSDIVVLKNLLIGEYFTWNRELLFKYQCGFWFSVRNYLLVMFEKCKKAVETKKVFGALLIDLSKAFYCSTHHLIIAKLSAFGFSLATFNLFENHLVNRKKGTKKMIRV